MLAATAMAGVPEKSTVYYYGEATLTNLKDGSVSYEKVIFPRVTDPKAGMISESGCIYDETYKVAASAPFYISVAKDGTTTESDVLGTAGTPTITGTGKLSGDAWNWDLFEYSLTYHSTLPQLDGIKMSDTDFIQTDGSIIKKAEYFAPGATEPFELYDVVYDVITKAQYDGLFKELNCPR